MLAIEWSAASEAALLASGLHRINLAADDTAEQVAAKQVEYARLRASAPAEKAKLIADAWCAAFVARKTPADPPITDKTTRALQARSPDQLVGDIWTSRQNNAAENGTAAIDSIRHLADQYQFTHLHLAFPNVFKVPEDPDEATNDHTGWSDGFDAVIGNPPWDQIQYDPRETFAVSHPEIAAAPTMAKRNRLIKNLADSEPETYERYLLEVHHLDGIKHFFHASGRYPLGSVGRLNTAPLFVELMWNSTAPRGQTGTIVPTGIATDAFTQAFFQEIVDRQALVSLYDFENRKSLFPTVHRSFKFCLLTLTGTEHRTSQANFAFFAHDLFDLDEEDRRFILGPHDFNLLNPNTKTCPVFRSSRDADITRAIYRRVLPLVKDNDPNSNHWSISFQLMFMMNTDSRLFHTRESLESQGFLMQGNTFLSCSHSSEDAHPPDVYLPLYEGKMVTFYDHRAADVFKSTTATTRQNQPRYLTIQEKQDPTRYSLPLYWVDCDTVSDRIGSGANWVLGFNDVTSVTNERTTVCTALPPVAVGHSEPTIDAPRHLDLLLPILNSFVLDYSARQKVGGNHLVFGVLRQLPVPRPIDIQPHASRLRPSVVELSYTAWDMAPFASDLGYNSPPFRWDEEPSRPDPS